MISGRDKTFAANNVLLLIDATVKIQVLYDMQEGIYKVLVGDGLGLFVALYERDDWRPAKKSDEIKISKQKYFGPIKMNNVDEYEIRGAKKFKVKIVGNLKWCDSSCWAGHGRRLLIGRTETERVGGAVAWSRE